MTVTLQRSTRRRFYWKLLRAAVEIYGTCRLRSGRMSSLRGALSLANGQIQLYEQMRVRE